MPLDYYEILQVSPHAELEVIQAAYKRLAFKYHPDRNSDPAAQKKMRDLNQAHEVLSDPKRRQDYDAVRKYGDGGNGSQNSQRDAGRHSPSGRPSARGPEPNDSKDVLVTGNAAMFRSAVLNGILAVEVEIQIAVNKGENKFLIVGLGTLAVKEGAERLKNALVSSGFHWPQGRITVNLAPADFWKEGTALDLPIAMSILAVSRQITPQERMPIFAIGVLNLDGTIGRCPGALSVARMVPNQSVLLAPLANSQELALLHQVQGPGRKNFTPYVVSTLSEAVAVVEGRDRPLPQFRSSDLKPAFRSGVNFKDIKGQERAKRALEVAAAGGHNVLLMGPPGEGKGLLANALPTILPTLSSIEIIELTQIYSARNLLVGDEIVLNRPFRPVHHGASPQAIVGGGSPFPEPGEMTLAHRGVLFLDELPEFSRKLLESLRQPLEDGSVTVARKGGSARFPCQIILAAAMNPCPCGFDGEFVCDTCRRKITFGQVQCPECGVSNKTPRCKCTPSQIRAYRNRISGPILDRIDLTIRVGSLTAEQKFGSVQDNETSETIRSRVEAARNWQKKRFEGTTISINARIPGGTVDKYCEMTPAARTAMKEVAQRIPEITTRGHDKLLKVARTVADLNRSALLTKKHIAQAADLCGHDRVKEFLSFQAEECASCGHPMHAGDNYCRNCGKVL